MPPYAQFLVIIAALLLFWAVVMRPARTQQKKVARLQSELEVGQEVVLSAGIFATVRALEEARVQVEIAPGTVITVARQVVVRRAEEIPGPVAHETHPDDRAIDPAPETRPDTGHAPGTPGHQD